MIDCALCGGAEWTFVGPLCRESLAAAARDVAALALDYRDLGRVVPGDGGPELRISGTHTPGVPLDLTADALQRDIAWLLGVWEPPVRELAGLPPAPEVRIRPARLVARAARVLSSRISDFARLGDTWGYPDGLEAGCVARSGLYGISSCRRLHELAVRALGLTSPRWQLPGLCSRCGSATLTRTAGNDFVDCGHCGLRLGDDDYQAYVSMMIGKPYHSNG